MTPNEMKALMDDVARLTKERDEARAEVERLLDRSESQLAEIKRLRAEIESKTRLLPSLLSEGVAIERERAKKAEAEVERLRTGEGGWTATFLVDEIRAERERLRAEVERLRRAQTERAIEELELCAKSGDCVDGTKFIHHGDVVEAMVEQRLEILRAEQDSGIPKLTKEMVAEGVKDVREGRWVTLDALRAEQAAAPAAATPQPEALARMVVAVAEAKEAGK